MQTTTILRCLIAALAGAATGVLIVQTLTKIQSSLEKEIIGLSNNVYLNGFKVWDFEKNLTFKRLARYLGCGLCYEASIILVLLLKGHFKTCYVFGQAYSHSEKEVVHHAWVEIKAYGLWWVIDSTWGPPVCPILKPFHYLERKARVVRKITDQELFSTEVASKMAEMIKEPKTSYVFHDLCIFRWAYWRDSAGECKEIVFEGFEEIKLPTNGQWQNLFYIDAFKQPITQKILKEFVTHDRRLLPKRRTFRKARIIAKTVERSKREVKTWRKEHDSDNHLSIEFTSIKTFKLTECASSS